MSNDAQLLRNFVEQRSESAFAELVRRHLGLVYHAALRQTGGDSHRAEDVAQMVFADLARKAHSLTQRPVLAGWLFTSTRYAAAQVVRSERRRRVREERAQTMNELTSDSSPVPDWNQLRPVIDDALHRLNERDREAVLLRFFEGKPFAEIGAKLSVSEDAARVRVDRALDKLRTLLSRSGVTSTSAALAALLANEAMASAPAGLAAKIAAAAFAGAAAAGSATAVATFIGLTKLQVGLAAALVLGGGAIVIEQQRVQAVLSTEVAKLHQRQSQMTSLRKENDQLSRTIEKTTRIRAETTDLSKLRTELALLQESKEEADYYRAEQAKKAKRGPVGEQKVSPDDLPYAPILRPSELDERPEPLTMVEPNLTPELKAESKANELTATATFIVDSTGEPRNIRILRASSPAFGESVMAAVAMWKFKPGVAKGKAVSTRMTSPFRMKNKSGPDVSAAATPSNVSR